MKMRWYKSDPWRGYEAPLVPDDMEELVGCAVVNRAGAQLRSILVRWLGRQHIRYETAWGKTSNVFSVMCYVLVEKDRLSPETVQAISAWFIDMNNETFGIFDGASRALDVKRARERFNAIVTEKAGV